MRRVLVTGATGFVGRHLLPTLVDRGWEVHAVCLHSAAVPRAGVVWHQCNVLERGQAEALFATVRASHWLHLAWYAEHGRFWRSLENFRWAAATMHMLEAFHRAGGRRVVAAGTCAEYDWSFGYCNEQVTPLVPATPYGVCKHATHQVMAAYGGEAGIEVAWGRLFHLFGRHESEDRLVPYVIRSLLSGQPAQCTHGKQVRDYLHVQDAAGAFAVLLNSEVVGPVNVASGRPLALRELLSEIGGLLRRQDLLQFGAVAAANNDPPLLVADVRRLAQEVGWEPEIDLERGLLDTIDFWKSRV